MSVQLGSWIIEIFLTWNFVFLCKIHADVTRFFICFFPQDDQTRAIWVLYKHLYYFLNIGLCPTRNKRLLVKGGWRHGSKYFRLRLSSKSTIFYLITYRVWWTVAVAISWVISFIISAKAWSAPNSSLKGPEIIWSVQRGLWPPGRCLTRWGATRLCPRPASGTWSWWSFPLPLPSASFCQQICRDKPKLYHKDKYIQGVPKKVWLSFKCS